MKSLTNNYTNIEEINMKTWIEARFGASIIVLLVNSFTILESSAVYVLYYDIENNPIPSVAFYAEVDANGTTLTQSTAAIIGGGKEPSISAGASTATAKVSAGKEPEGDEFGPTPTTVSALFKYTLGEFIATGTAGLDETFSAKAQTGTGFQHLPGDGFGTWELLPLSTIQSEEVGQSKRLDISLSLDGELSGTGLGSASVSWSVSTSLGDVSEGRINISQADVQPFSLNISESFNVVIGQPIGFNVLFTAEASGENGGSYLAEVTNARVDLVVIPEPSTLILSFLCMVAALFREIKKGQNII